MRPRRECESEPAGLVSCVYAHRLLPRGRQGRTRGTRSPAIGLALQGPDSFSGLGGRRMRRGGVRKARSDVRTSGKRQPWSRAEGLLANLKRPGPMRNAPPAGSGRVTRRPRPVIPPSGLPLYGVLAAPNRLGRRVRRAVARRGGFRKHRIPQSARCWTTASATGPSALWSPWTCLRGQSERAFRSACSMSKRSSCFGTGRRSSSMLRGWHGNIMRTGWPCADPAASLPACAGDSRSGLRGKSFMSCSGWSDRPPTCVPATTSRRDRRWRRCGPRRTAAVSRCCVGG